MGHNKMDKVLKYAHAIGAIGKIIQISFVDLMLAVGTQVV